MNKNTKNQLDKNESFVCLESEYFNKMGFGFLKQPIVFYEAEYKYPEEEYWYIETRAVHNSDGIKTNRCEGEVIVKKSDGSKQLFSEDVYVNTTQIFIIQVPLLEKYVGKNNIVFLDCSPFRPREVINIHNGLIKCRREDLIQFQYVSEENNRLVSEVLYENKANYLEFAKQYIEKNTKYNPEQLQAQHQKNLANIISKKNDCLLRELGGILNWLWQEHYHEKFFDYENDKFPDEEGYVSPLLKKGNRYGVEIDKNNNLIYSSGDKERAEWYAKEKELKLNLKKDSWKDSDYDI